MIRNLKVLGLALSAVFAFAAISASAVSAQGTLTTDGQVTLTGKETGTGSSLTAFGIRKTCSNTTYKGHAPGGTSALTNGATTITLTPHFTSCHIAGTTFGVTTDMNGCDFVLHLGGTTNASIDEYAVTTDLVCPEGKDATVTIFWDAHDHATNKPFCVFHIKPQTGLKGAEIRDTTNGHLDLTGTVEGIHVVGTDFTSHALFCPVTGDEQTIASGKLDLDITVWGDFVGTETPTALGLSHP